MISPSFFFHPKPPNFFFKYARAAATTSTSSSASSSPLSVHSPLAFPQKSVRYNTITDMISTQFQDQISTARARAKIVDLGELFHNQFQTQATAEFFSNCEASHSGITNFSSEQNDALNRQLLLLVSPNNNNNIKNADAGNNDAQQLAKLFLREDDDIDRVIELGAGTGRVSAILSQVYANEFYEKTNNNNNNISDTKNKTKKKNFLFLEPDARLARVCEENVRREFMNSRMIKDKNRNKNENNNNSVTVVKAEQFWESLKFEALDAKMLVDRHVPPDQGNDEKKSILIVSGVAQYLTDKTLLQLLSIYPRVLLQEDVAMPFHLDAEQREEMAKSAITKTQSQQKEEKNNNNVFSIYHERDGSFVRSENYYENIIFNETRMKIKASSIYENDGCVTKTWALKRED